MTEITVFGFPHSSFVHIVQLMLAHCSATEIAPPRTLRLEMAGQPSAEGPGVRGQPSPAESGL
jgi:hypothetical protein